MKSPQALVVVAVAVMEPCTSRGDSKLESEHPGTSAGLDDCLQGRAGKVRGFHAHSPSLAVPRPCALGTEAEEGPVSA